MLYRPDPEIEPGSLTPPDRGLSGRYDALAERMPGGRRLAPLMLTVVAPTLVVALYLFLFGANQYLSTAQFIVRGGQQTPTSALGQMMTTMGAQPAQDESSGVDAFLVSHDAVAALQKEFDLVAMFRRPFLDVVGKVKARPTPEDMAKYWKRRVKVRHDQSTGISTLEVLTFRPEDSKAVTESLLRHGELLVNQFSARAEDDALRVARVEVNRQEARLQDVQAQMTRFRNQGRALDPTKSAGVVMSVTGGLEAELAKSRAALAAQRSSLMPGSPSVVSAQARVAALQQQVASQNSRLTGVGSLAPVVSGYERLALDQEIAAKGLAAALAAMETARIDAQKQHQYLVRVVQPNTPVKSLYPQRWLTILSVFVSLLVAYGIGWLILVGVREHAS